MPETEEQQGKSGRNVEEKAKPQTLLPEKFLFNEKAYPSRIVEVKLGATRTEGGSRGRTVIVGGESAPAFWTLEQQVPHLPVLALDVFDMEIPLPKAVKMHVTEVINDPAAWAKLAVERFEADLLTVHLVSIDPLTKNASSSDAVKTIEKVVQAVDVPLIIGGCGDPKKDTEVFEQIAETFHGERFLFSSVTSNMDLEKCTKFIKRNGHAALAFTPMNLNLARQLNRRLYEYMPREDIVMDLTTAALGYGLEYAYSNMEKARLEALKGDSDLAQPMCSGTTNAWAAREAWMKMSSEWEPRELRGPLWELTTALTLLFAGVDLFMMMHPAAVKTLRDTMHQLINGSHGDPAKLSEWVNSTA
jgi:acetyl-CoA decarbonylase/synthase complex subunit delta